MLQSKYLTEDELKDFGFKSLGSNVKISSDARIYGQQNISIGNNVRIDDFSILSSSGGHINIRDYVFIGRNAHLSGFYNITIHSFSSLASYVVIYTASDDYTGKKLTGQAIPQSYTDHIGGNVSIGKHVIIGTGTTVIGECIIGEGCSVGSKSMVNKDLEPWGIFAGIPCKKLKDRKKDLLVLEKEFLDLNIK